MMENADPRRKKSFGMGLGVDVILISILILSYLIFLISVLSNPLVEKLLHMCAIPL